MQGRAEVHHHEPAPDASRRRRRRRIGTTFVAGSGLPTDPRGSREASEDQPPHDQDGDRHAPGDAKHDGDERDHAHGVAYDRVELRPDVHLSSWPSASRSACALDPCETGDELGRRRGNAHVLISGPSLVCHAGAVLLIRHRTTPAEGNPYSRALLWDPCEQMGRWVREISRRVSLPWARSPSMTTPSPSAPARSCWPPPRASRTTACATA